VPSEKYDIVVKVSPSDRPGAEIEVAMPGILRANIMHPSYQEPWIRDLVLQLEKALE
jgi:hypothetical protein